MKSVQMSYQDRIIDNCRHTDQLSWDLLQREFGAEIPFTDGHAPPATEYLARYDRPEPSTRYEADSSFTD